MLITGQCDPLQAVYTEQQEVYLEWGVDYATVGRRQLHALRELAPLRSINIVVIVVGYVDRWQDQSEVLHHILGSSMKFGSLLRISNDGR